LCHTVPKADWPLGRAAVLFFMANPVTSTLAVPEPSLPDVNASVSVSRSPIYWKRLLGFIGPGFLIAVGYMDPGNWATDIAGGARFGYTLLFVIMLSNLLAILLQSLSLKLGVATDRDLAQICRDSYGRGMSFFLWIGAEIAIAACDLAEVIGAAIALNLLFHLPLMWGVLITGLDVMLILLLQRIGFRYVEALVIALIGIILALFIIQTVLARPDYGAALGSMFVPSTQIVMNPAMLYIAIGILGATVMPHNLYLHSSIVQSRRYPRTPVGRRDAIRLANVDSAVALTVALFVNAGILVVAAAVFHSSGHYEVAAIEDAYKLLSPLVGTAGASTLFAIALLASGQNSSITGTLAGQIVMEGFLHLKVAPWMRRLITRSLAIIPTIFVVAFYGEHGTEKLLILSQVILSLQLSFAVVPLVMFTGRRSVMGEFVNARITKILAWSATVLIVVLNGWLLVQTALGH
jgi:manganese transport protein